MNKIRTLSFRSAYPHTDISTTFQVTSSSANNISFLEHVVVTMSLTLRSYGTSYDYDDFGYELILNPDHIYTWLASPHPKRGDIQITLTSPQGTTSTLLPYRLYDFVNERGYSSWPFMSVHHWGENPVGSWNLRVSYRSSRGYVSMSGLHMRLYGTTVTPPAVAHIPSRCDHACRGRCSGTGPQSCDVCRLKRVAITRECVSSCPRGTHSYKNYCLGTPAVTVPPPSTPSTRPPTHTTPPAHTTHPPTHTTHRPTHMQQTTPRVPPKTLKPPTPYPPEPPTQLGPSIEHHPSPTPSSQYPPLSNTTSPSVLSDTPPPPPSQTSSSSSKAGAGVIAGSATGVVVFLVLVAFAAATVVVIVRHCRKSTHRLSFTPLMSDHDDDSGPYEV
jgi:hypothetical protein